MTDGVVERIDLPGADENHGLLIEPQGRRAFIACEGNDRLLVLDLQTKKITASFEVGKDPDVLAFDPGLHYVYVAGEAGVVSIFNAAVGPVSKIAEGFLGPNAHVVAVDPTTHQALFPADESFGSLSLAHHAPEAVATRNPWRRGFMSRRFEVLRTFVGRASHGVARPPEGDSPPYQ